MSNSFENKVVLITGGTTGIGFATAQEFQARGARVIVTGSNADRLAEAQKKLGATARAIRSDAGSVAAIKELVTEVGSEFGKIDVLIANAGVARFGPLESWDEEAYDRMFGINVKGPFFLIKEAASILKDGASIVVNTSIAQQMGLDGAAAYGATKGALRALIRGIATELAARKIRVNAVSPGPIETPIYSKLGMPEEQVKGFSEFIVSRVPLGRFGQPTDIANAIRFLASDDAAFITGEELVVDGGLTQS